VSSFFPGSRTIGEKREIAAWPQARSRNIGGPRSYRVQDIALGCAGDEESNVAAAFDCGISERNPRFRAPVTHGRDPALALFEDGLVR
jgi:hypothetical protein